ncbi:MAG: NAD-dependent epimerase/dehydratase family protein [Defluviitaleaceae bacterium]|nr:NAD-dependent epimerase/dehydratase family protein [Defluviitaleaceae bacterium]
MKILITGKTGYIATAFYDYVKKLQQETQECQPTCKLLSVRDESWRRENFAEYDVILHTAALVHRRETAQNSEEYYKVNRDLTYELAKQAKLSGVRHFVFLSTISVYGLTTGIINKKTPLSPKTHYGKSKLAAENLLLGLADETFKVAILRPPMVYGENCPGNYAKLRQLVKIMPFFPDYPNQRSVVHISTLCEFIHKTMQKSGVFFPQDRQPLSTRQMAEQILVDKILSTNQKFDPNEKLSDWQTVETILAEQKIPLKRRLYRVRVFNPVIRLLLPISVVGKIFGSLVVEWD